MTANAPHPIGLLLVNWNSGSLTRECLGSVLAGTRRPERILVVDNASHDGSDETIQTDFPSVELVRLERNLGFTGANNLGIRQLREQGMDAVWILNNDTIVAPECLANLAKGLWEGSGSDTDADVTTGKIYYSSPADRLWYAGGSLRMVPPGSVHRGIRQRDRGQFDTPADVTFVCGCCMLIRTAAFDRVGLFDDRFFAYYEDFEWSYRAGLAGLRMRYIPTAIIWHRISASVSRNADAPSGVSPLAHYLQARNQIFILRLHRTGAWQTTWRFAACALQNLFLLAGLGVRGRWAKARSRLSGIKEGLMRTL